MELLAPCGSKEKLTQALHFGADAVYLGGKDFSLRAFADNFDESELAWATEYTHSKGKKIYVTVNIFPSDSDYDALETYVKYLESIHVDGAIVSDLGLIALIRRVAPKLPVHVSTQANITNSSTARVYADMGCERVVLARELSLDQIREIRRNLPATCEIECFVHGAMCISYSGRCLLSSYLTPRDSNRGECVQACRWSYQLSESSRPEHPLGIEEDERGTYILNSRDLNMLAHLKDLQEAGVASIKIEGRMKTAYYVSNVVNAYRRALDYLKQNPDGDVPVALLHELDKCNNRTYSTGFYYSRNDANVCSEFSQSIADYEFVASVLHCENGRATVQMRNRFREGDTLEVLSSGASFNQTITVTHLADELGAPVADAKNVMQILTMDCSLPLETGDILRREKNGN